MTIPIRIAIERDCLVIFLKEMVKLQSDLKGKRICITMDPWNSIHNINYMRLTRHFIDNE